MGKRTSVTLPSTTMTLLEAEQEMATMAKADATISKINAQMDLEISKIREKNQDKLAGLTKEKDDSEAKLMLFCTQNKEELFSKKKSIELAHGQLGFRTGTPALKALKGFTLASCLKLAKEFLTDYVRTKEELDKDALISARNIPGMDENYSKIGVQIVQEEKWFVELKKEETATA